MPIVRATVSLESATGIPADRATNTFHFDCNSTATEVLDNVLDLLTDFYTVGANLGPITDMFASDLYCGSFDIELYNLDDPIPRPPIASRNVVDPAGTTQGMPAEVALVLSFEALPLAGQVQARRRGRIYIPWLGEGLNSAGRPTLNTMTLAVEQANQLLAASDASVSVDWVVWSPTSNAAVGVARGWVDDSWDTQRRRGWEPTERFTFPLA
jgi:hypothetical protein